MARIRTIKPEFWTSEQVVECSPTARLLFVGMWNFADDGGVHPYSWKRVKMQVFPGDSLGQNEIEGCIEELLKVGLLKRFVHENKAFLLITGWHHQKIDKPSYKFPQPKNDTEFDDYSANGSRAFDEHSPPEGKGREGRVKERNVSTLSAQSSGRSETYPDEFILFWSVYPKQRRTKKQEAFRKWKLACKRVDASLLTSRASDYANSEQGRSEYAVMPSVWLSSGMWEDDPTAWNRSAVKPIERRQPKAEGAMF